MIVIPSIDIQNGQCVRLVQGDFNQVSFYSSSSQVIAKKYNIAGAVMLHVVDLDGAKNGKIAQFDVIADIVKMFDGIVQVGGGIRDSGDIDKLFKLGVKRVVLGTHAVNNKDKIKVWVDKYGAEAIVLALDFKIKSGVPYVAISGWQEDTTCSVWDILEDFKYIKYILCTDINKDGMQEGPNMDFYEECQRRYPEIFLQASGGIASMADLQKLNNIGVQGAIVGKAIYENKINLQEAVLLCSK